MELLLIGVSHRTTPLERREALAFDVDGIVGLQARLRSISPVHETLVLSTCNRTEIYAAVSDVGEAERRIRREVHTLKGGDLLAPDSSRYLFTGSAVARHLFRVTSGLDSIVLGDVQILGQVKAALALGRKCAAVGPLLARLFEMSLQTGKLARARTGIGTGVVSMASAATALAEEIGGPLRDRRVLIVGAGETGRLIASHVGQRRPASLVIINRTLERAETLALATGAAALPLSSLAAALADADFVFSATSAPSPIVTRHLLAGVLERRQQRPLLAFDLAMPRDIEASVAALPHLTLHTIDSIRSYADRHLARRLAESVEVERIVDDQCQRFLTWRNALRVVPAITRLRERGERIRLQTLKELPADTPIEERERAERLTRTIMNRRLHEATQRLKDAARDTNPAAPGERVTFEGFHVDTALESIAPFAPCPRC